MKTIEINAGVFLGLQEDHLRSRGAINTAREITHQPEVWRRIAHGMEEQREPLNNFMREALQVADRIILTGAGTSAFIGLSLRGLWQRNTGITTESIASTDFVTHPADWIESHEIILLVSFARSGNSPESVAVLQMADQICRKCIHLIITCNPEGELARCQTNSSRYVIVLPAETNDLSLAMTSSYTGMLLTGLLIAKMLKEEDVKQSVAIAASYAERLLKHSLPTFQKISELNFDRAVFLGSGPLQGTAIESHLKLQELTDGHVICTSDSFLGFRHGPKAVVNEKTLVVYLFSNQPYAAKYERDLVQDMHRGQKPLWQLGIAETELTDPLLDEIVILSENGNRLDEDFLPLCMVIPAQLIGFYKSLQLGLQPDAPSASGAISRVVEGVKIYPFENLSFHNGSEHPPK